MKLKKGDYIVTAWAEYVGGPGWSNAPIWVIVKGADGVLRQECIQPNDQTEGMYYLFSASAAVSSSMTGVVRSAFRKPRKEATVVEAQMRTLRAIHELAAEGPGNLYSTKTGDVKKRLGLASSTLGNHLRALQKEGYITRGMLGAGRIYLTRRTLQELGKK